MLQKIYLVAGFWMITILSLPAQTFSIGPLAGLNAMTISNTNSSKILPGLLAGAFANYSFQEHFGLNGKLLFSQMGTGTDSSDDIIRLNYIQLPISLVYFFGNNGNTFRPKIFAGLYGSYLLQAKNQDGIDIEAPNGDNIFNNTDAGAQVGLGLNYIIGSRIWLNVDLGYSTSFGNIAVSDDTTCRNQGFQLSAGVSFPLSE